MKSASFFIPFLDLNDYYGSSLQYPIFHKFKLYWLITGLPLNGDIGHLIIDGYHIEKNCHQSENIHCINFILIIR